MANPKVKIGDRFDKLKVVERAEDIPSKVRKRDSEGKVYYEQGKTKSVAWLCECDCGNKVVVRQNTLLKKINTLRSCGECPPEKNPNYIPPNMDAEEYQNWCELYEYVREKIMGYNQDQSLSSDMVTRLKGLATGNYKANKRIAKTANHSYKTILNTFKFCSPSIQKALRTTSFKDEQHKFNYISKIVENNINNVYLRMQQAEKAKEKTESMTLDTVNYTGASYQQKTKEVSNRLLDELW